MLLLFLLISILSIHTSLHKTKNGSILSIVFDFLVLLFFCLSVNGLFLYPFSWALFIILYLAIVSSCYSPVYALSAYNSRPPLSHLTGFQWLASREPKHRLQPMCLFPSYFWTMRSNTRWGWNSVIWAKTYFPWFIFWNIWTQRKPNEIVTQ